MNAAVKPRLTATNLAAHLRAFEEMEGDAVPFLLRWLNARPTAIDNAYAGILRGLPAGVQKALPPPRDDRYYSVRAGQALDLLGLIGKTQRFKSDVGEPGAKTPITVAVPYIHAILTNDIHGIRSAAAQALGQIGPSAAGAVPELIKLADDRSAIPSYFATQALGAMGPAASNAVEVLVKIAFSSRNHRITAVQSLGGIGGAAQSAVPALTVLLKATDFNMRMATAQTLGEIGFVPDEVVPALIEMRERPDPVLPPPVNSLMRTYATFALWVHEPGNSEFKVELADTIRSKGNRLLTPSMARLGPKAAPFIPDLTKLTEDSDPEVRRLATTAVRRIQSGQP